MKCPEPNKKEFKEIILRRKTPSRVHFVELHIDKEVIRYFAEKVFNRKWIEPSLAKDKPSQEIVLKDYIEVWRRLGYDCLRLSGDFRFSANLSFVSKKRVGKDTASGGERRWAEEGKGTISSWEDFERYRWPELEELD